MTAQTCEELGPDVELRLVGHLDAASSRTIQAELDDALALRPENLLVDLSRCTHLGASVLGRLLVAQEELRSTGASLLLRAVPKQVAAQLAGAGLLVPEEPGAGVLLAGPRSGELVLLQRPVRPVAGTQQDRRQGGREQ